MNVKRLEKRTKDMDDFEIDDECGVFHHENIVLPVDFNGFLAGTDQNISNGL